MELLTVIHIQTLCKNIKLSQSTVATIRWVEIHLQKSPNQWRLSMQSGPQKGLKAHWMIL